MVSLVFFTLGKGFLKAVVNHVKFATNNGFNSLLGALYIKIKRPKHITVVGNGNRRHIVLFGFGYQLLNLSGSV